MALTTKQRLTLKKNKKQLKWTRAMLFIFILISCISTYSLYYLTNRYFESSKNIITMEHLGNELAFWSDYLTKSARHFVVTTNPKYLQDYWYEVSVADHRKKVIDTMLGYGATEKEIGLLNLAKHNSDALISTEIRSVKLTLLYLGVPHTRMTKEVQNYKLPTKDKLLIKEKKIIKARNLLFGKGYDTKKQKIMLPINDYRRLVISRFTKIQKNNQYDISVIFLVLISSVTLSLINFAILMYLLHRDRILHRYERLKQRLKKE
jgi:hypothetical protein